MTATQKAIAAFFLGLMLGGSALGAWGLHELKKQNETHIATIKQIAGDWNQNTVVQSQALFAWTMRAEQCEAKFQVGTMIYEPRPAFSVPVLNGAVTLSLGGGVPGGQQLAPVWYVPAQVTPQTNLPGARYQWIDARTGAARGALTAAMPPAGAADGR
jgi:hypothetical protein